MSKINILQPNVFNMISAGEVVERPSSVVKELVENSIDAGATSIDILVEQGGLLKIQVSDNGVGIEKDDMRNAFLPHATSKLKNITDLDSLATLGFRGEALASISSVSEVTLISSYKGVSSKICLSGGKVALECEDSRAQGTIITVENLFFNTPARLKFMKKASSELHYVEDVVRMLILANPSIRISLSNEDGLVVRNDGGTLLDAIYSVYGAKIADNLLEIKQNQQGKIKIAGYVSKVDFVKPNRTYQTIIVNGRAVQDVTVQTAVEKAYAEFLMKRTYPVFILDVLMPFDDVDVNVHPSKTEIRFVDKQAVFSAVYHATLDTINESISGVAYGFDIGMQNDNADGILSQNTRNQADFEQNTTKNADKIVQTHIDTSKLFSGKTTPKNYTSFNDFGSFSSVSNKSVLKDSPLSAFDDKGFANSFTTQSDEIAGDDFVSDFNQYRQNNADTISQSDENDDGIGVFDGKIVGQIFDTYIVCERGELVYLIDQHAAHERILYDRILKKFNVEFKQPLLIPYKLTMTGEEEEYFDKIVPNLEKLGFDLEHDGKTYLIKAVPEPVSKVNFAKFFADLFANMQSENELTLENLLKDKLCQQACKAAIKGGDSLSRAQIERVIKNYVDENGNLPTKCPHGRPAVIAFSKTDVEKMFKRIV